VYKIVSTGSEESSQCEIITIRRTGSVINPSQVGDSRGPLMLVLAPNTEAGIDARGTDKQFEWEAISVWPGLSGLSNSMAKAKTTLKDVKG